jgi:starch synthase
MQNLKKMKILFVSAEVSPFAKTGGLADVAGSLPQSLAEMGNDVRVVMPKYKAIKSSLKYVTDFPLQMDCKKETCIIRETNISFLVNDELKEIPIYFTDSYHYYDRDGIYCFFDDAERFIFFCKAVIEMLPKINFQPDVIHCNDWHTGPICMMLNEKYKKDPFYSNISTAYTIHNLEYQGNFPKDVIKFFNMDEGFFNSGKTEFYGMFSFMKSGLAYSDVINTVSEKYSKEIQTPEFGEKMEGILIERSEDLFGIVNGISYQTFNPSNDPRIYKNFDAQNAISKKENKIGLQKEMGLPVKDVPVIGVVTRLTGQKGLNLIVDELNEIMKNDIQFILLGEGDGYYENSFKDAKMKYPDKIGTYIGFNAALAQRVYAGSDIFLMPSRFEPCGLGQIISLRYGTIPIVRATGGLADTVVDIDTDREKGNGFSFDEFSSKEMLKTVNRAIKLYNDEPAFWQELVVRALNLDYSWSVPAKKYMDLYNRALNK